jgi:hypothetical protein
LPAAVTITELPLLLVKAVVPASIEPPSSPPLSKVMPSISQMPSTAVPVCAPASTVALVADEQPNTKSAARQIKVPGGFRNILQKPSCVLHHYAFDDVGHVLTRVRRHLDHLEYFLPLDDRNRIGVLPQELRDSVHELAVRFVLKSVDLHAPFQNGLGMLEVAQALDRLAHLVGAGQQGDRHVRQLDRRLTNFIDVDDARSPLDHVHDIIHLRDQAMNVIPVEGGDEDPVKTGNRVVGDLVAGAFHFLDLCAQ